MDTLLRVVLGAGGGALGGALAGFVAAILALFARQVRNAVLHSRGLPGIKDAILPLPFVILSAMAGVILGGALGIFLTPLRATLIGALVPAGLLAAVSIVGAIWQAYFD